MTVVHNILNGVKPVVNKGTSVEVELELAA